jgi:hypothetical protein
MHQRETLLSLTLAMAVAATGAIAAEAEHDQHHPGAPPSAAATPQPSTAISMAGTPGGAGNMPMMGMMQMMMGQNGMAGHVDGRITSEPN